MPVLAGRDRSGRGSGQGGLSGGGAMDGKYRAGVVDARGFLGVEGGSLRDVCSPVGSGRARDQGHPRSARGHQVCSADRVIVNDFNRQELKVGVPSRVYAVLNGCGEENAPGCKYDNWPFATVSPADFPRLRLRKASGFLSPTLQTLSLFELRMRRSAHKYLEIVRPRSRAVSLHLTPVDEHRSTDGHPRLEPLKEFQHWLRPDRDRPAVDE
jgi:hypothetical protein